MAAFVDLNNLMAHGYGRDSNKDADEGGLDGRIEIYGNTRRL
jgi:hypothetical protein